MGNLKPIALLAAALCAVALTLAVMDERHSGVWAMAGVAMAVLSLHEKN